ncbi:MAG: tRNA (adenosine(37)-N6)-threonylcarbamoyltransferase complex ATPase subunit type 1 TsaE [Butyricimonas paravirosa]
MKNIEEAMDFGYEEYFYSGNRCFIEWPEMVEPLLPENTLICKFSELADGRRELVIEEKL